MNVGSFPSRPTENHLLLGLSSWSIEESGPSRLCSEDMWGPYSTGTITVPYIKENEYNYNVLLYRYMSITCIYNEVHEYM